MTSPIYPVLKSMSKAMDLISETVVGHNQKVAYIALRLGEKLNLSSKEKQKLVLASLIHDLGVFYLNQNFSELTFDSKNNQHALVGFEMSKNLFPDSEIPEIIKYHHHEYHNKQKEEVPFLSDIIHLADRIAVLIKDDKYILNQSEKIKKIIKYNSKRFWPEAQDKFLILSEQESFWLNLSSSNIIENKLDLFFESKTWNISLEDLKNIGILISHIIDFRSTFTATHSHGVAASATALAHHLNFNEMKCKVMEIAGFFHDLGKLVVPADILNKPEKLNDQEWQIMKSHTFFTYHSLNTTDKLTTIKEWASYHHEKLNGQGYPFQLKEDNLSLGARIMAVADVFTAITEDRPYRRGMTYDKVKKVLTEMGQNNALDLNVAAEIVDNFTEFNSIRYKKQKKARNYYNKFKKNITEIIS